MIFFKYYFCFIWFQEDFMLGTCFLTPVYLVSAYTNDYAHVLMGWHPNGYYRYAFHIGIVGTNLVGSYMRNLETTQMVIQQQEMKKQQLHLNDLFMSQPDGVIVYHT